VELTLGVTLAVLGAALLHAAWNAMVKSGRDVLLDTALVTLGGAGAPFRVSSRELLAKEQEILGSRYVTRREVLETLALVARREVWPVVSDIRPLEQAEALHQRLERGEVIGRAALTMV